MNETRTLAARTVAVHLAGYAHATAHKAWREEHPPTPHADYDLRIVDHWAPHIAQALGRLWAPGHLRLAIDTASRVAPLGDHQGHPHRALIASVAKGHLRAIGVDTGPLTDALRGIITDARTAGTRVARIQAAGARRTATRKAPEADVEADWGEWEPGHPDAALHTADGALRGALDDVGASIRGLIDTTLDRVGNLIADGLLDGDSVDTIAGDLRDYLGGNLARSELIAHTETARAMTSASIDRYAAEGFTRWDWMTTSGACRTCVDREANNPHDMGDPTPPGHPHCRCAVAPVVESHPDWIDTAEPG